MTIESQESELPGVAAGAPQSLTKHDPAATISLSGLPELSTPSNVAPEGVFSTLLVQLRKVEDEEEANNPSAQDAASPYAWIREAAVVLAAASALLYVASEIYGDVYLSVFGIKQGFHGFGIANLSMITFPQMLYIAFFGYVAYATKLQTSIPKLVGGLLLVVLGVSSSLIGIALAQRGLTTEDGVNGTISVTLSAIWVLAVRHLTMKFNRNHQRYRTSYSSLIEKIEETLQDQQAESIKNDANSILELVRRRIAAVVRRTRVFRVYIAASAGFLTATLVLPDCAKSNAVAAASIDVTQWKQLDAAVAIRIPVYWVADRYVYLTNNGKDCLVHVSINGVEQARRRCPALIEEASQSRPGIKP